MSGDEFAPFIEDGDEIPVTAPPPAKVVAAAAAAQMPPEDFFAAGEGMAPPAPEESHPQSTQREAGADPVDPAAKTFGRIGEGRVPAHDLDAEAAVISAVLLDRDALDKIPELEPEHFYSEANRRIYEAVLELRAEGEPVDIVTVGSRLKDKNRLQQVGGTQYIGSVLDGAPVMANITAYARRVRERARIRALSLVLARAYIATYGEIRDHDVDLFFEDVQKSVDRLCESPRVKEGLEHIGPITGRMTKRIASVMDGETQSTAIATGFTRLDRMLAGGFHEGDLVIIGARPGVGKTSLVLGAARNVAHRGYGTAIFSLEMPKEQLAMRLVAAEARVNVLKARSAEMGEQQWSRFVDGGRFIEKLHIWVDDTPGLSLGVLSARVRRLKKDMERKGTKLGLVVVDYLQLMRVRDPNRLVQSIGETTTGFKNLAKELMCPFVVLSQLSRAVETRGGSKKPVMADLRESGSIEQDADTIVFIYRDEYYNKEESKEPNIAELDIAKQRNGPTGHVKMRFDKETTRFDNLAEGEYEDE